MSVWIGMNGGSIETGWERLKSYWACRVGYVRLFTACLQEQREEEEEHEEEKKGGGPLPAK